MEAVKSIIVTYKNSPIGSVAGGVIGYYIAKKFIKTDKLIIVVPVILVSALLGSGVEHKIKFPNGFPDPKIKE